MIRLLLAAILALWFPATALAQLSITQKTSGTSNAPVSQNVPTGSFTPAANALMLASVTGLSASSNMTATGNGLTWIRVLQDTHDSVTHGNEQYVNAVFCAQGPSPTTGALTFTFDAGVPANAVWKVIEITGAHVGATCEDAIVQALYNMETTGTSYTGTLAAFFDSTLNASVVFISQGDNHAMTPDSPLTELGSDQVTTSPDGSLAAAYHVGQLTNPSVTVASNAAGFMAMFEVLDANAMGGGGTTMPLCGLMLRGVGGCVAEMGGGGDPMALDFGGYRPHIQGFAADTVGGRTGGNRIGRVTSLTLDGTPDWNDCVAGGSLDDCLAAGPAGCDPITGTQAACARFVLCDISGIVAGPGVGSGGASTIIISHPYLTYAGQTCPMDGEGSVSSGDGLPGGQTWTGFNILIDTHDIVLQHTRQRLLDWRPCAGEPPSWSGLCSIGGYLLYIGEPSDPEGQVHVHHILLDHCTLAWNVASTYSYYMTPGSHDIQMVDCLVEEPSYFDNNFGNYGGGGGPFTDAIQYTRTAFLHAVNRNPQHGLGGLYYDSTGMCCKSEPWIQRISMINVLTYNGGPFHQGWASWLYNPSSVGGPTGPQDFVMVGGAFYAGPDSGTPTDFFTIAAHAEPVSLGVSLYLDDNRDDWGCTTGASGDGQWACFAPEDHPVWGLNVVSTDGSEVRVDTPPTWFTAQNHVIIPSYGTHAVRDALLVNVGAYPIERDYSDALNDIAAFTGTHYKDPDTFVVPTLAVRTRTCNPPSDPNGVVDAYGRTRIEYWLEGLDDFDGTPNCDARRMESPYEP